MSIQHSTVPDRTHEDLIIVKCIQFIPKSTDFDALEIEIAELFECRAVYWLYKNSIWEPWVTDKIKQLSDIQSRMPILYNFFNELTNFVKKLEGVDQDTAQILFTKQNDWPNPKWHRDGPDHDIDKTERRLFVNLTSPVQPTQFKPSIQAKSSCSQDGQIVTCPDTPGMATYFENKACHRSPPRESGMVRGSFAILTFKWNSEFIDKHRWRELELLKKTGIKFTNTINL